MKLLFKIGLVFAIIIGVLTGYAVFNGGFTEKQRQDWKHVQSETIGLKRNCVRYAADGHVIEKYSGRFRLEHTASGIAFIDENNKTTNMLGEVTCREE